MSSPDSGLFLGRFKFWITFGCKINHGIGSSWEEEPLSIFPHCKPSWSSRRERWRGSSGSQRRSWSRSPWINIIKLFSLRYWSWLPRGGCWSSPRRDRSSQGQFPPGGRDQLWLSYERWHESWMIFWYIRWLIPWSVLVKRTNTVLKSELIFPI